MDETKDIYYYLEQVRREAQRPPIDRLDYFFDDVNKNTRKFVTALPEEETPPVPVEQPRRYLDGLLNGFTAAMLVVSVLYILHLVI